MQKRPTQVLPPSVEKKILLFQNLTSSFLAQCKEKRIVFVDQSELGENKNMGQRYEEHVDLQK